MKRIAVEEGLTPVKNYLSQAGYQVQEIDISNTKSFANFDAVVLTGSNENMLGIQTTSTKAPVIDARGKKPEDISREIANKFS